MHKGMPTERSSRPRRARWLSQCKETRNHDHAADCRDLLPFSPGAGLGHDGLPVLARPVLHLLMHMGAKRRKELTCRSELSDWGGWAPILRGG